MHCGRPASDAPPEPRMQLRRPTLVLPLSQAACQSRGKQGRATVLAHALVISDLKLFQITAPEVINVLWLVVNDTSLTDKIATATS